MKHFAPHDFEKKLVLFTDGSSLGNPGPGGYGCVIVFHQLDELVELGGNKTKTTNNEMELSAVIAGLSYTSMSAAPVEIFTDSSYVINGITKWVQGWEKNGWKTTTKQDVANKSLWQTLISLVRERETKTTVSWNYVPGHVGVIGNERCDEIATGFAAAKPPVLFRGKLSQYPRDVLTISIDPGLQSEKAARKNKSSVPAYSYLSLVDGVVKRHRAWADCEARVKGKKAKFKKATSEDHEREILKEWGVLL